MKRREFLKGASIVSLGALTGCASTSSTLESDVQSNIIDNTIVLPASSVHAAQPSIVAWGKKRIGVVKNSDNSFSANILTCTHRGCTLSKADDNYVCPCHGARFTHQGKLIKGPAEHNLASLDVTAKDHLIYIHLPVPTKQ